MPYSMIDVGKGTGGGMQKQQMPGAPNAWALARERFLICARKRVAERVRDLFAGVLG